MNTATAAPAASAYITLPIGCSLPEHGALPADSIVVLARGEFWNSQYRKAGPDLTMHIAVWGLPTVALCRATLVDTKGTETYVGRDGATHTQCSEKPDIAGRDDARFGYPDDSDCAGCKRAFARMTRETLPADIRYPMIDARRADRERKAAEKAARLAGEVDPTAVEPIDLAEIVEAATVEPMAPSTDLVPVADRAPARTCGTGGAALDLNILRAGDVEPGTIEALDLHAYDVVLINISAGKDSMALLIALVALAHAQGYDLSRLIAVHCDLGRVEWAGTAELAEEHARTMGVQFYRVANSVDLLAQVRQRFRNLQRKAGELAAEAAAALEAGNVDAAAELQAQATKKAAAPAWFSSKARYCTKSQKTGEVEKLMTALAKLWREAGNDRPIRILNTLGIRAQESAARALKTPLGPDGATNTRREVTRWLPIFGWSEAQVWDAIRKSGLRVHGAYVLGMSRLSCALCVLGSKSDMLIGARANRALVDEYGDLEDEVGSTFLSGTSVREIGARADELGPLELPAPRALDDVLADQDAPAADVVEPAAQDVDQAAAAAVVLEAAQVVAGHAGELLTTFGATRDLFGDLVAPPRHTLALAAVPAPASAAATPPPAAARPELHTDALFALPAAPRPRRRPSRVRRPTVPP